MRNGMFLLNTRRTSIQTGVLGADTDVKTEFGVVLPFSAVDHEFTALTLLPSCLISWKHSQGQGDEVQRFLAFPDLHTRVI